MKRLGTFVIIVALIVGLVGCAPTPTQYNLTVSTTEGGEMTAPGDGTFTYDEGTAVPLVAFPHTGYRFVNWTGDVSTIDDVNAASTTITMNGDYSITANFAEEEPIIFGDSNLEAAIREALGKPGGPIYTSNPEGLASLSAAERNISDLSGLEHATSLTQLDLRDNRISDISTLADITNSSRLFLCGNNISDISPLASLTSLTKLLLTSNQISDISPLANLTYLKRLHLYSNQMSDISALVQNEGLSTGDLIDLRWNPLSSDSINIYIPQLEARGVEVLH